MTPIFCLSQISSDNRAIFTRKEGLSNNTVTSIIKDNRGFLWVGTSEGLNRFDGQHFTTYFSNAGDLNSLGGDNIYDILQYRTNMLLIATSSGVSVLNTTTNHFENDRLKRSDLRSGSGIYVRSLFKDAQGHIYINSEGEIDVFDQELHFLYRLTATPWGRSLKGIIISYERWYQDSMGRIWMPSDNFGVCLLDEKKHQVYSSLNNPDHYPFMRMAPVRSFLYDELKQQIFVSFWGEGLMKYDLATGRHENQDFNTRVFGEARTINTLLRRNNRIICCGTFCVYSLDPETMQYEKLFENTGNAAASLIDCYTALNDGDNIWVGTETKGLFQISNQTSSVKQISLPHPVRNYSGGCTGVVQTSKDILYFSYGEEGLIELNQQNLQAVRYPSPPRESDFSYITRISRNGDSSLLVGTDNGIFIFDTHKKKFSRTKIFPASTDTMRITALVQDPAGNCWFASRLPNALGHYEIQTHTFSYYPGYQIKDEKVFHSEHIITRMTLDEQGNMWMTSSKANGEISRFETSTGKWTVFGHAGNASIYFKGKELNGLYVRDSVLWTGNAYGMGLIRYSFMNDHIQRIGRKDGLLSENIFAITPDKNQHLFISTQSGINYYNTITGETRTLILDNGSIDWGFSYAQYFDSLNDRLIYGLNDRILIANQSLWERPMNESAEAFIDEVRVNDNLVPFTDSAINLTHTQRNINIRFAGVNYNRNVQLQYAYRMEGLDRNWTYTHEANTTNYSNLSPGSYRFLVKVKGNSGAWGPVNSTLHFVIFPAIWQTAWFWISVAMISGIIVFVLVRRRIGQIRKSAALSQKLAETEMLALRSQMNPHFIFNCLNAIDNLMQTNQPDKATTYLNRFAKLIRSVLENSKSNEVSFHKDLETLRLYLQLEQFRAGDRFSYELVADEELINGAYKIPPLIIQPFIENAILHGLLNKETEDRQLHIEARLKGSFIMYRITDNGVGRKNAGQIKERNRPEHISYGIQITTERLQLHNQKQNQNDILITDLEENGIAAGTRIEVMIRVEH